MLRVRRFGGVRAPRRFRRVVRTWVLGSGTDVEAADSLPRHLWEHMELYQLKTFAAVAETGHLTRAADRLHPMRRR